jgi:hypothetical protein
MEEGTKQEETRGSNQYAHSSGAGSGQVDVKGLISQLEALLDEYMIKKAPFALPIGVKEFIVNVSPYLIIIFAVLALPLIFAALGLSAIVAPVAMMGGYSWGFGAVIALVVSVVVLIMEVMAVPGLFKRTRSAWNLIFYATIVSLIGNILSIGGIIGGIIGAIIGWYILFQVKDMYKN